MQVINVESRSQFIDDSFSLAEYGLLRCSFESEGTHSNQGIQFY